MQVASLFVTFFAILALMAAADLGTTVKIRIEGKTNTIYVCLVVTLTQQVSLLLFCSSS